MDGWREMEKRAELWERDSNKEEVFLLYQLCAWFKETYRCNLKLSVRVENKCLSVIVGLISQTLLLPAGTMKDSERPAVGLLHPCWGFLLAKHRVQRLRLPPTCLQSVCSGGSRPRFLGRRRRPITCILARLHFKHSGGSEMMECADRKKISEAVKVGSRG